jgi:hypothetical protein
MVYKDWYQWASAIGVRVTVGLTAFVRMLFGPNSLAIARVIWKEFFPIGIVDSGNKDRILLPPFWREKN